MCKVKNTLDVTYYGFVIIIVRFESYFRGIFPVCNLVDELHIYSKRCRLSKLILISD
jgi:hypothetical protein